MATPAPIDISGQSGNIYRYHFLESIAAGKVKAEAGNYMFIKRLANGNAVPIYIGEAQNLSDRLSNHDRWDEAKKLGATQIYAHVTPDGEKPRLAEEKDLIQRWNPVLNVQHRKAL